MAKIICNLYTNRRSEAQRKLMPYVAGYGPSQNKHKKLMPGLVAFTTSGLETEQVNSQKKRQVREEITKEKVKKRQ